MNWHPSAICGVPLPGVGFFREGAENFARGKRSFRDKGVPKLELGHERVELDGCPIWIVSTVETGRTSAAFAIVTRIRTFKGDDRKAHLNPPTHDTSASHSATSGRPVFVWIICGYYCVSLILAGLSLWLVHSVALSDAAPAAILLRFIDLSGLRLLLLHQGVIGLAGAAALFFLRRVAVYLFTIGLLAGISFVIYQIVAKAYLQTMGSALPSAIGNWMIRIGIIFYARHLAKTGVLR